MMGWCIAYVVLLVVCTLITLLYWYVNRPIVDLSGPSPGITTMIFDDYGDSDA